jgi:hypothetical protein
MNGLKPILALCILIVTVAVALAGCADRPVTCDAHLIPINPSSVPELVPAPKVKPP